MTVIVTGPRLESVIVGETYRHRKSGRYYEVVAVGTIEATMTPCVIYKGHYAERHVWVRPLDEFMDGRFEWYNDQP
jgi:hypothetical protein